MLRYEARQARKETCDDRWKVLTEQAENTAINAIGSSLLRPFQFLTFEPICINFCTFPAVRRYYLPTIWSLPSCRW